MHLSRNFKLLSLLQDYMTHGSQGLFTQVGFNDPSQDDASQSHYGVANANPLQSQVFSSSDVFNTEFGWTVHMNKYMNNCLF